MDRKRKTITYFYAQLEDPDDNSTPHPLALRELFIQPIVTSTPFAFTHLEVYNNQEEQKEEEQKEEEQKEEEDNTLFCYEEL